MSLIDDAHGLADDLVAFRRRLHTEPEIGLDLPRTQEKVLAELDGLHLETTTGTRTTSVTGVLRGGAAAGADSDRPVVLLRADMDALPVHELVDVPYRSTIDNAMHACGHDLHMAMLAGAARLLDARRDELPGDVVLMFQPGEEGFAGGRIMVEDGVLEAAGRRADSAFGMHVFSALDPHGTFATRPGPMLAASGDLDITVRGRGGHGSAPQLAQDPVTVAAEIVLALQNAVTRKFSVFDPVVVTVGLLQAGSKRNVIPDEARIEATVRSFSDAARARIETDLPEVARGIARAHGLDADVEYTTVYPVTSNDVDETALAASIVEELFEGRHHRWSNPLAGSEDFSFVLREVPGTFVGLAAAAPGADVAKAAYNHSPRAYFDDAVLADGAALYAEFAIRRLAALAGR